MKILAPLLVLFSLVCLTSPDGYASWVMKEAVVAVLRPVSGECTPGANSKVTFVNGTTMCVQEDRKAVVDKLNNVK